jgi:hypothetical protein
MKLFNRCVVVAHRYLGLVISLLIIVWFVTGIAMMYAGGMPRLSAQLRLERLADVDLSAIRLSPAQAAERLAAETGADTPGRVQLVSLIDRPVYRVGGATVFADTGDILEDVDERQAQTIVAKFLRLPEQQVHHVRTLTDIDQWTLQQGRLMPLYKFAVDDEAGTEAYVQASSGEIAMLTTRRARGLAWISTIPHWLYFTALRGNQPLWLRLVVWTSAAASVLALLGLILSVTQLRRVQPFSLSKAIPYSGPMRWHYITGAVFGLFTLTWAFSGLVSMEPWAWTEAPGIEVRRNVFTGGSPDLARFAAMDATTWRRLLGGRGIKEVDFARIQDEHYYVVRQTPQSAPDQRTTDPRERLHAPYDILGRAEPDRVLVNAETLAVRSEPFSTDSLIARLKSAVQDAPIVESELLADYDSYYYSRSRQTPLPVLRVKFGDPAETWVYVDPEMSQVLAQIPYWSRVERWAYNGLHSWDFAFWYKQPLWDVTMLTMLFGGLASSCLGLVMGVRRMRRAGARVVRSLADTPVTSNPQSALSTTSLNRSAKS